MGTGIPFFSFNFFNFLIIPRWKQQQLCIDIFFKGFLLFSLDDRATLMVGDQESTETQQELKLEVEC